MATSIITVSMNPKDVELFESLKLEFDTDLSKVIVALVKHYNLNKKNAKYKKEIGGLIKNA